jgi:hypothetical protein
MNEDFRTRPHRAYAEGRQNRVPLHRADEFYEGLSVARPKGYTPRPRFRFRVLRNWLRKQVGRPWNMVYSEACKEYDLRTIKGREIRKFLNEWGTVDLKCFVDPEGEVRTFEGYCGDHGTNQFSYFSKADGLYVHPESGLLCYREVENPSEHVRERKEIKYIKLADGSWYEYLQCNSARGPRDRFFAWFHCTCTVITKRYFNPISESDLVLYEQKSADESVRLKKEITVGALLKGRGFELVFRKGVLRWGKYCTEENTNEQKSFCTKEQLVWIAKYIETNQ